MFEAVVKRLGPEKQSTGSATRNRGGLDSGGGHETDKGEDDEKHGGKEEKGDEDEESGGEYEWISVALCLISVFQYYRKSPESIQRFEINTGTVDAEIRDFHHAFQQFRGQDGDCAEILELLHHGKIRFPPLLRW